MKVLKSAKSALFRRKNADLWVFWPIFSIFRYLGKHFQSLVSIFPRVLGVRKPMPLSISLYLEPVKSCQKCLSEIKRRLTLLLRLCGYWSQDLFNTQWWILVALKRADYGSARTLGCNWVFFGIIVRQLYCRTQFGPLIGPIQKPPSSSSKMMPTCKFSWQPRIIRFSKLWLTRLDSSFT